MDSISPTHAVRGNYCIVCKCWSTRTHHLFPKVELERKKWLEILNLKEDDLKKNTRVCNEHFNSNCYSPLLMTRNRLFRGSLPNPVLSTSHQMSAQSSPKTNSRIEVANASVKESTSKAIDIASSSRTVSKPPKRMCFIGDIYFPLVKQTHTNFRIAKGIIQKQRKKIELLQEENCHLRLKIINLRKLLKLRNCTKRII